MEETGHRNTTWREESTQVINVLKQYVRSAAYYKKKVEKQNLKRKAMGAPEIKKLTTELEQYGYWYVKKEL